MAAPPVLVMFPVRATVVLVIVPNVSVIVGTLAGVADTLAWLPAPAEFTARTLNV